MFKFSKNSHDPQTAEEWFIRNRRADLTEDDCIAFLAWLERDEQHEADYAHLERVSSLMTDAAADPEVRTRLQRKPILQVLARPWVPALAASFALVSVSAVFLFTVSTGGKKYHTDIGEQRVVILEDGSLIRLNTSSKISVNFNDVERRVIFHEGEAFFDVDKDTRGRPFLVETDNSVVRVLGTEFNVRLGNTESIIGVVEGVVEVLKREGRSSAGTKLSEVKEGFKVSVMPNGDLSPIEPLVDDRITAWIGGRLEFDAESLATVLSEFNRYSTLQLSVSEQHLGELLISGSFVMGRSEEFADGLTHTHPVKVVRERNKLILQPVLAPAPSQE